MISRALFAEGRLWLRSDDGVVSTIAPGAKERVDVALPGRALDICVSNGHVVTLTCDGEDCKAWTLRRRDKEKWTNAGSISPDKKDERDATLDCGPAGDVVVTGHRLFEVVDGKVTARSLDDDARMSLVTSLLVTKDWVYAGFNAGEWGGGLRRIDRKTGRMTVVEKNATGGLCDGPLNTACDPVNGIAQEPWKPECIAIAIGLVHFTSHGRIVEVCGEGIKAIYTKALGEQRPANGRRTAVEPDPSVSFFGLVSVRKQLVAAGIDGLYRFDGKAEPTFVPLPKFDVVGNVGVSFSVPDVVLVLTGINQRRSISGAVPLVVPR
ncbi:MAG: hypothetical protein JWM82_4500 [Myxococcales bacterium]|nr:hypothetical protein [Myxococcales bacterium]